MIPEVPRSSLWTNNASSNSACTLASRQSAKSGPFPGTVKSPSGLLTINIESSACKTSKGVFGGR